VIDDAKPEAAAVCVGDAAQQVLLKARRQKLAVRGRDGWRADGEDAFRAALGMNGSFDLDQLSGEKQP
jgi:hypothetical protein